MNLKSISSGTDRPQSYDDTECSQTSKLKNATVTFYGNMHSKLELIVLAVSKVGHLATSHVCSTI